MPTPYSSDRLGRSALILPLMSLLVACGSPSSVVTISQDQDREVASLAQDTSMAEHPVDLQGYPIDLDSADLSRLGSITFEGQVGRLPWRYQSERPKGVWRIGEYSVWVRPSTEIHLAQVQIGTQVEVIGGQLTDTFVIARELRTPGVTSSPDPSPPPIPSPSPSPTLTEQQLCQQDQQTSTFSGQLYSQEPRVSQCQAGQLSPAGAQFFMDRLNFFRQLHGLAPVSLDPEFLAKAQQGGLMMAANDSLNHNPPTSWRCYTSEGAEAAGSSNLFGGGSVPLVSHVDTYLIDPGESNKTSVGHRRWSLYPDYAKGAFGVVIDPNDPGYKFGNAQWVFGFDASQPDPEFVAFPAQGLYPYRLTWGGPEPLTNHRWSLSVNARFQTSFSSTAVMITDVATGQPATAYDIRAGGEGFGNDTMTYSVSGVVPGREYRIEVTGIRINGLTRNYSYTTKLVDCQGAGFGSSEPFMSEEKLPPLQDPPLLQK